ncbi:MAG TPA: MIP/aquaporin family protein [Pyrinomonadaceae bacterium]|nr:MIP/aquaporin family protein [Pyrinomonadaceae bacterium]
MNKYICEFIGTFFLVLTVGSTVIGTAPGVIPPLAIGSMLMVMIFATGHISGGHLNPAVTLAVWMRGKCDARDVPGYFIGQIAGGVAAAYLVLFMKNQPEVTAMQFSTPLVPFFAEFLGAFAIAFVVLNVATAKANQSNSFYGLAIGFTVVASAFALGSYSGGAFNPAVAIGMTTMGLLKISTLWIHLVGNFAGGAIAAVLFKLLSKEDAQRSVVAPADPAK